MGLGVYSTNINWGKSVFHSWFKNFNSYYFILPGSEAEG